ncbi:diguanylate cyclase [Phreatobacter sp.]|uniref:diguanylate cyclase n=1 Tax=Phreatobacter sp. TaxID=1966341 RepID=UPI003F71C636
MPTWRVTRWLTDTGRDVPDDIRRAMVGSLFTSLPVFIAGLVNSLMVAAIVTALHPQPAFILWLAAEALVCGWRLAVLVRAHRLAALGERTPTDIYLVLALAWSATIGLGAFVSLTMGSWPAAVLACISVTAMIGGMCFRNFAAPRLTLAMMALSLIPLAAGALVTGQWVLIAVAVQVPLYLAGMGQAAYRLKDMLVTTMKAERDNRYLARHDALTGLTNRTGLIQALEERLAGRPGEPGARLAVLYLDLDGFKQVNDRFGHAAGDAVLRVVAERLNAVARAGDVTARIGGDEFVLIADEVDAAGALAMGERLIGRIATTYALGGGASASIGVSVGIACAPDHGACVSELLALADAALYLAKAKGKSRCAVADEAVQAGRTLHSILAAADNDTAAGRRQARPAA